MSDSILSLLSYVIHLDDPYGEEHGERVSQLSERLAKEIGITDPNLSEIVLAAKIHDIGKIAVPESVRRRPGKLSLVERLAMETHPTVGAALLEHIRNGLITSNIISYVKHHHENWAGDGYPDKLAMDRIPLGARIIRIADTFDAITHTRDYKGDRSAQEALHIMEAAQIEASPFDPEFFTVFIKMMRQVIS